MTERDIEIWLFQPGGASSNVKRMIKSECSSRGWRPLTLRRTTSARSREGRLLGLIKGEDAINLYKRVHRARVGVFQIGDAHVLIKPQPRPAARDYVQLRGFVKHKAFYFRIPQNDVDSQLSSSLTAFRRWLDETWCDGEGDPRCLPFHVFETEFETDNLFSAQGRSAFAQMHGPQSSRVDYRQFRWKRPQGAYHGSETLHVGGCDLVRGFHWDVSNEGAKRNVATISGTWEIPRNGYVNVYPDAHIRGGRSSKRVKKAKAR